MAKARRTATAPKNETKEQKFVRLANMRVNKAIKAIRQIGQLGAPTYESTTQQRNRIAETLQNELSIAVDGLNSKKVATQDFKL